MAGDLPPVQAAEPALPGLHERDGKCRPGTEECVEVFGPVTEPQWRYVEWLLGRAPDRFKDWSTHRVVGPVTTIQADILCAYLREQNLPHDRETTVRWSPGRES